MNFYIDSDPSWNQLTQQSYIEPKQKYENKLSMFETMSPTLDPNFQAYIDARGEQMKNMHDIKDYGGIEEPSSALIGNLTNFENEPENVNDLEFMSAIRSYQSALFNRKKNEEKENVARSDDITSMNNILNY